MRMIPCGFDPDELQPVDRDAGAPTPRPAGRRPIVLQLGRMVPRKGVDTVIRALGILERALRACAAAADRRRRIADTRSRADAGDRTPAAYRRRGGVGADVQFAGQRPRSELRYFYSAADVFVTMPWYEPFGITPVEAMACGVPVIGARVGGVQYSVEDGRTGFLVEAKNADALARRLAHVFSNPSIPRLLGKRGRRRAWERFTWSEVSRSLADLYAEVAGDGVGCRAPPLRKARAENAAWIPICNTKSSSSPGAARVSARRSATSLRKPARRSLSPTRAIAPKASPRRFAMAVRARMRCAATSAIEDDVRALSRCRDAPLRPTRRARQQCGHRSHHGRRHACASRTGTPSSARTCAARSCCPSSRCRFCARASGDIVNVASTAAKRGWPNASAYHASKWGLLGLSYALHAEFRAHGIRVTAVIAGGMRTPFPARPLSRPRSGDAAGPASTSRARCASR